MKWLHAVIFLLLTGIGLPAAASAQDTCHTISVTANSHMQWKVDATASQGYAGIPLPADYPKQYAQCWDITNTSDTPLDLSFYLENPRAHHVALQQTTHGITTQRWFAGVAYPLTHWNTLADDIQFDFSLEPRASTRFTLQLGSYVVYTSTLYLSNTEELIDIQLYNKAIAGILTGLILVLVIYFCCLALSSREITYFYLGGSTLFVTFMQLSDLGLLYRYWPEALSWNQAASYAFGVFSTVFGCCLARQYLHTREAMPRTDSALNVFAWFLLLVSLPTVFMMQQMLSLLLFALPATLFMISLIIISIVRIRQGFAPAKLYLLAYILPMLSGFTIVMMALGIVPSSPTSHLIPLFGTAMQLLLFALALGWRIRWLEQASDQTHLRALQASTETQAKRQFLAQVSHDVRTPLIGIIGLCELLDRKLYTPSENELIDGMENAAHQLLEMTNTLLDHAKLDAGKWPVNNTVFHLRELLSDVCHAFEPAMAQQQLRLSLHTDSQLPNLLQGDSVILQRILHALLDNACKFTRDGKVSLRATVASANTDHIQVRFDITDTGAGLDTDFLQRAFNSFELADESSTRQQQGVGLGLSLCRKFCELVDGSIGYQANVTGGSTFWFVLPFTLPGMDTTSTATITTPTTAIPSFRTGGRVLVAEDDDAIRLILESLLQRLGIHDIQVFAEGKSLLDQYRTNPEAVSLVLTDWHMPVMNGQELLIALRQYESSVGCPPVPVVIMSAYDAQHDLRHQLPDSVPLLYKPVTLQSLRPFLTPSDGDTTA